jgi:tRNA pseudouridine38-40 synthase
MSRYFLELSYKGTNYSGFQVQENAKTIQSEVTLALQTLYRQPFNLTGSSRTDAGVHAIQNFFHFDTALELAQKEIYNLNALLPQDIAVTAYYKVDPEAHSRFSALGREYNYFIYNTKNPFLYDRAWYYPFNIEEGLLHKAAQLVSENRDFTAFSKRNTQVNNFHCAIAVSEWKREGDCLVYHVEANRFLRGMVRALVSSMLRVARGTMTLEDFGRLLTNGERSSADFSAPAHGLFLIKVAYPPGMLIRI